MGEIMKKLFILLFIIFLCQSLYSEAGIGNIIAVKGEVRIDQLGTGIFIDAQEKNTIYMISRIKTGNSGTALVVIMEKEVKLYPGTDISGEELYKETRITGFEELMVYIYSTYLDLLDFLFPTEEGAQMGFRGDETIDKGIAWQDKGLLEDNIQLNFFLAIMDEEYMTVLTLLDEHRDLSVSPTDLGLLKGLCHFHLRHYEKAYTFFHGADATLLHDFPDTISESDRIRFDFYRLILYQKCIAAYVTGREDAAREQLPELMEVCTGTILAVSLLKLKEILQIDPSAQ
jgi:hypothetical protein